MGAQLKTLLDMLDSYVVRKPEEQPQPTPAQWPLQPVAGLQIYDGFRCLADGCDGALTRNLKTIQRHVSQEHGKKPAAHLKKQDNAPLWEACKMQTFYGKTEHVHYFVVDASNNSGSSSTCEQGGDDAATAAAKQVFLRELAEDNVKAIEDEKAHYRRVQANSHRYRRRPLAQQHGDRGTPPGPRQGGNPKLLRRAPQDPSRTRFGSSRA
jgi:hypothetical protein